MKNVIVYGPTQSGVQRVSSILKQYYESSAQKYFLGSYFNVFGDKFVQPADNKAQAFNKGLDKEMVNSFVVKFTKKDGKIKAFNDYNVNQGFSAESELSYRTQLLDGEKDYLISLSSWEDLHDRTGSIEKQMEKSELIFIKPDDTLELLLSYGLAHNTCVWVTPESTTTLDTNVTFKLDRRVFSSLADELKIFKGRLQRFPSAKVLKQSQLSQNTTALSELGLKHKIDTKEAFGEPRFKKDKLSYFSNKEEIKTWALELEKILS
jgi:hypothetical protein